MMRMFPNDFPDWILLITVDNFKMRLSKVKLNIILCFLKCTSEKKRLKCFPKASKMEFSWLLLRISRWDSLDYLRMNSVKFQWCPKENIDVLHHDFNDGMILAVELILRMRFSKQEIILFHLFLMMPKQTERLKWFPNYFKDGIHLISVTIWSWYSPN